MDSSSEELVASAVASSNRAVQFDTSGQLDAAIYYYREAARFLSLAASKTADSERRDSLNNRATDYGNRASQLLEARLSLQNENARTSENKKQLQKCKFLFSQALNEDEAGHKEEAVKLYTEAVEVGLSARAVANDDQELQAKLTDIARSALERAEELKGISHQVETKCAAIQESVLPGTSIASSCPPVYSNAPKVPQLHRGSSAHLKVTGGQGTYTEEEKRVLLMTSHINRKEYVPFMSIDLGEKFQYPMSFTDRDGYLSLSPKQRRDFSHWARPEDISSNPKLIVNQFVDCFSIKQTIVSDCSFVASLAVSALYERRFGRSLITSIIYPRNRQKQPVYNPFGKYMVKLHINGVPRKIIIDDTFPVNKRGELLCSYSTNKNEFWISLMEKAYMKVMGGYDFPGSNSNIDLHALTGWIPERMAIKNDPTFNSDGLFEKLLTRMAKGDVLVTVATGELSDAEAERSGLVPTHAYAVLDIKKIKNVKLLQLKNPWSHLRWRGNYSELDTRHWTPELKAALNFDPNSAAMFDNGVFWIDYESILSFYDVFYLNWNPGLFNYTDCIHQSWKAGVGPIKDAYNIGENPQFSLEIQGNTGAVWILLTRHITQIEDFKENREYITVLVYRTDHQVFYPHDPPPFIDGVRINSPHYLCKLLVNETSAKRYTLVVSQYEKMNTIYYTLRVYGTCPFTLRKIGNSYESSKQINGQWKGITAGGCGNNRETYMNNPRYQITLDSAHNNNHILIDLKGPKQYQIGMDIITVILKDNNAPTAFKRKDSGPFRSGFVVLQLQDIPAGTYDIVPSTFLPRQEGPFILTVKSSVPFKLAQIQ